MPKLPVQLLKSLAHLDHFEENAFVEAHDEKNKITSIRLNPFKKTKLNFELKEVVAWSQSAFYLSERPSFTHDPLFQAGCYYVQEAGSMFIEYLLKNTVDFDRPLNVLDLCAAPGGKTTLINSLLSDDSLLVGNEFVKSRADILALNLSKWGTKNTVVTNNDPERFTELSSFFDVVLVDAPCSGSGLFRKQPEAIDEWSPEAVGNCSIRQKKILKNIIPALKENGILIYSTCSYSEEENEEVVASLLQEFEMEYIKLPLDKNWGIVESLNGYRFYPHLTKSEGFFCSILRKKQKDESFHRFKKKTVVEVSKNEQTLISGFLQKPEQTIFKKSEQYYLFNKAVRDFLTDNEKQFYFKKAGVRLGEIKGKDFVPNQELAWSNDLNPDIKSLEMDEETALHFLKKEALIFPSSDSGLTLMRYHGFGLGWAKILPNRVNNYLPNELRILK